MDSELPVSDLAQALDRSGNAIKFTEPLAEQE